MLTVLVTMRVQSGNDDKMVDLFAQLDGDVRKEAGNHRYELYRSTSEPSTFLVYEEYDDKAALDAHNNSSYIKATSPIIRGLLSGKPEAKLFQE